MGKKDAVIMAFAPKIRQETARTAHHKFQSDNAMARMKYERTMIHNYKANPPPGMDAHPSTAVHKQHLADARQAMHSHNAHMRESTEKTNQYVWEMVRQAYN